MSATVIRSSAAAEPPVELVSFAMRQIQKTRLDGRFYPERRSEMRQLIVVPVRVQPLDEESKPVGEPFTIVTRDVSTKSVGLIAMSPILHRLLALEMYFSHDTARVIAEVIWSKPMGPFEGVGCRIVRKLDAFHDTRGTAATA
jgi:hypothetical protein